MPWQALSPIKKMTNISAASHIYTKLQLAGLTPQDFAQWSTEEEYVKALGNERFEIWPKENTCIGMPPCLFTSGMSGI